MDSIHESIVDKRVIIALNRNWQAIGYTTPRKAIVSMCGGEEGFSPPALALDVTFDEEGALIGAVPTKWDDWLKLPVREGDFSIQTARGVIRCPTIIVSQNFADVPKKAPRLSTGNIFERDGFIDQYTGEKLSRKDASVDHVLPVSRGGKNDWTNMVTCHKKRNHSKGNKLNEEVGLRLIKSPKAPQPMPVSAFITEAHHPDHGPFINK